MAISVAIISCNSNSNKDSESSGIESSSKTSSNDGNSYECLKKYQDRYDQLITKEEFASLYPFDSEAVKEELQEGSYGRYALRWPSDRPDMTMEVSGRTMTLPDQNSMEVALLSFSDDKTSLQEAKDYFDMGYKNLSDKELEQIDKNLEKADENIKNTGKDLMEVRKKMNNEFVDGVGSSAWYKWTDNHGGELSVLAGRAQFKIRIKISQDADENKELAKKLAQIAISKCH